jgi:hypothetical protein
MACACGTTPAPTLVRNGDFAQWSRGPSADPDGWARVADLGRVERVDAIHTAQGYAARYTRVDSNVDAFQDLPDPASLTAVTCSAWVASDSALVARLVLDDGATFASSWNQKTDGPQYLAVSHTKSPDATRVRLVLDVSGASPSATVPGTSASFDAVECHSITPNVWILFRQLSTHERGMGLALNVLIAITALLAGLAWYQLRRKT